MGEKDLAANPSSPPGQVNRNAPAAICMIIGGDDLDGQEVNLIHLPVTLRTIWPS